MKRFLIGILMGIGLFTLLLSPNLFTDIYPSWIILILGFLSGIAGRIIAEWYI